MKDSKKYRLVLISGGLISVSAFAFGQLNALPDFFYGLLISVGIGLQVAALIKMKKQQLIQQKEQA